MGIVRQLCRELFRGMIWHMNFGVGGHFLLGLLLVSTAAPLAAQQYPGHPETTNTFTGGDGTFRFKYPDSLIACRRNPDGPDHWLPTSCEAFTPVCSNYACDSESTAACVAYPADKLKGTNFQAAAFSVNKVKNALTDLECLKVEEPPTQVGNARREMVGGVSFTVIETDGVATGNLLEGYVYRAFHSGTCYELDIRIAYSNPAYAEPDTVKSFNLKAVHQRLQDVLDTFEFVK